MSAAEIRESLAELREAGRHLRRRRAIETVNALGQVLELWRDPGSPPRDALAKQLPEVAGFTEPVVREGLALGVADWTREALQALVAAELGGPAALDGLAPRSVSGFDVTAVVLAGSLPTPTLLAILAPLVLRSPVLVKPASRDPLTAEVVRRSLAMVEPELADCVAIAPFDRDDAACVEALAEADCVVASGSDETIAALAAQVAPSRRFVGYGHRLSVAALGPDARSAEDVDRAMADLALDVALWDQQGCLSPVALWVVGDAGATQRAAESLAARLDEREARLPRGAVADETRARIAQERDEAEMRAAAGEGVAVHAGEGTRWTVVVEADARPRPAPLGRFVRVHPVADLGALHRALSPLAPHLAGVGVAGFAAPPRVAGASRICPLGSLQAPPLAWCRDGRGVLPPLARLQDRLIP